MITKKCYGLEATSLIRVASKRASELSLSFLFPHLAPGPPFAGHSRVTSLDIRLKWRASSQTVTVFIVVRDGYIVIIMALSIPSVPIPPKASAKC